MDRRHFFRNSLMALGAISASAMGADAFTEIRPAGKVARRRFGDMETPLLGFGLMRLPRVEASSPGIDQAAAEKLVARAFEAGVNYFDTAYMYHGGLSEKFVGAALSKYPRDSYLLASKMPCMSLKTEADVERIFNEQLERTKAGYFDYYLMHSLNADNWRKAQELHVWEFMQKKKAEGKIRHIGFSFHDAPSVLQKIVDAHKDEWEFAQIQLNYLDWDIYKSKEQYEILEKAGIPVIIMEPLRGGSLATLSDNARKILTDAKPGSTPAEWAFRYVASFPRVMTVLSGMGSMRDLDENIATFTEAKPLSDAERKTLDKALLAYRGSFGIPCTACRYCMPCPEGVDIPVVFGHYNQYKLTGSLRGFERNYANMEEGTRIDSCIQCGLCMEKCPQHIAIPDELEKIEAELNKGKTALSDDVRAYIDLRSV